MTKMDITISQIKILDAVAREKNFSKAAVMLGISQPAVSLQLRTLQKRYGVKIYYRRGKEILLSGFGQELANTCRKVLGLVNDMDARLRDARELVAGKIHIGLSCHYFVKGLLAKFMGQYPGVRIKATIGHSSNLREAVLDCRMDVAEITASAPDPALHALEYSSQEILLFVSREHSWAGLGKIHIDQLHGEKMVALHNQSATRRIFNHKLEAAGIQPEIILELDNWDTMKEVVAAGIGFGISLADEFGPDDRLVKIPLGGGDFTAFQYIVCLPEYRELKAVSAFLEIAAAESETLRILNGIHTTKGDEA